MQKRGQGAIEYLLVIGAAIMVVAIVILMISGVFTSAKDDSKLPNGGVNNALEQQQAEALNKFYLIPNIIQYYKYSGADTNIANLKSTSSGVQICNGNECADNTIIPSGTVITIKTTTGAGTISKKDLVQAQIHFADNERIQNSNTLHYPIVTKNGNSISTQQELVNAYSSGDITMYKDGAELSIVAKPNSKRGTFITNSSFSCKDFGWAGDCIDIGLDACYSGSWQPLTKSDFITIEKSENEPQRTGEKYHVSTAENYYFMCSNTCWSGPCAVIKELEITSGMPDSINGGWEWGVYTYDLQYGTSIENNIVGINPASGEITGITGNIAISYYYNDVNMKHLIDN